jgi:hypothetical protein
MENNKKSFKEKAKNLLEKIFILLTMIIFNIGLIFTRILHITFIVFMFIPSLLNDKWFKSTYSIIRFKLPNEKTEGINLN